VYLNQYSVMNVSSLKTSSSNRFERRKQRTRAELVAAATRVLARQGLQSTKIADIAAAADVGVGTFYLHFDTKEALYDALVEDAAARLKAEIDAAREGIDDPVAETRAATEAMCRFARDNREVFKLVFDPGASHHDVVRRAQALFAQDIEQSIRRGIERGVFGAVPPAIAAQALVGMSTQLLAWWTEHEAVPVEWLNETIVTLTLRGLSPR
jgi:AcrR family transcriptional regulator